MDHQAYYWMAQQALFRMDYQIQSYKWHLPLITWIFFSQINPLWISHNYLTDHQISNEIECHPSTVLPIEHQLIASPKLEIDNLELDFIHKLKSNQIIEMDRQAYYWMAHQASFRMDYQISKL